MREDFQYEARAVLCVGSAFRDFARWWLLLLSLPALTGCSEGVLAVHGPVAAEERQLLFEALVCMLLVVVPVILLTVAFAWWFRASNRAATYRPTWCYSGRIEFTIWIIPMLVVLFLAALSWSGSHELDPYKTIPSKKTPLTVEVVSMDWKWLFVYPEQGIATVNELAIPVGRPVNFKLTSATVMNSFFIPGIAGQIYTMAGMQTRLSIQASDVGSYRGMSAQFSGDGFSDMRFDAMAMNDSQFDAWVGHVRSTAYGSLSKDVFDSLASTHSVHGKTYYSQVDGDVFEHALAMPKAHPAGGPMPGMAMSNSTEKSGP